MAKLIKAVHLQHVGHLGWIVGAVVFSIIMGTVFGGPRVRRRRR